MPGGHPPLEDLHRPAREPLRDDLEVQRVVLAVERAVAAVVVEVLCVVGGDDLPGVLIEGHLLLEELILQFLKHYLT